MKSARNIGIEDRVEVHPKTAHNLPTDNRERLRNVNRWRGIPQQNFSVKIVMSGGGQATKIVLQLHESRGSDTGFDKRNKRAKVQVVLRVL